MIRFMVYILLCVVFSCLSGWSVVIPPIALLFAIGAIYCFAKALKAGIDGINNS